MTEREAIKKLYFNKFWDEQEKDLSQIIEQVGRLIGISTPEDLEEYPYEEYKEEYDFLKKLEEYEKKVSNFNLKTYNELLIKTQKNG